MLRSVVILILFFQVEILAQAPFGKFIVESKITLQLGSPINAIALKTNLHFVHTNFEIGVGCQSKLFFSGLGPKGFFFENRLQTDAKIVWGKNMERTPLFVHALFNKSNKAHSLSYAYFWFWDSRKTSQRSGAWSTELGNFFFYFENDLFAGEGYDRFRTGTLQFMLRQNMNIISINTRIWTGETKGAQVKYNAYYNSVKGYKDLSENLHGKYSNGILSISFYHNAEFQPFGFELGFDHEKIRNVIQNKMVHDFPFLAKKNPLRNRHLPMLDSNGFPFLNTENQKIKPGKIVFQGNWGFNEN